jgi:hypothetical protein
VPVNVVGDPTLTWLIERERTMLEGTSPAGM